MEYYMVFGASTEGTVRRGVTYYEGSDRLVWWPNPVGVFGAKNADEACMMAAKKSGRLATFAAVPVTPWGISMLDVEGGYELGDALSEADAKVRATKDQIKALEKKNGDHFEQITTELDELEEDPKCLGRVATEGGEFRCVLNRNHDGPCVTAFGQQSVPHYIPPNSVIGGMDDSDDD